MPQGGILTRRTAGEKGKKRKEGLRQEGKERTDLQQTAKCGGHSPRKRQHCFRTKNPSKGRGALEKKGKSRGRDRPSLSEVEGGH